MPLYSIPRIPHIVLASSISPSLIISIASDGAWVNTPYAYTVRAEDPENEPLTYSLDTSPQGMSIDPETGLIQWTPNIEQTGNNSVTVKVQDLQGAFVNQSFTVDVPPTHRLQAISISAK